MQILDVSHKDHIKTIDEIKGEIDIKYIALSFFPRYPADIVLEAIVCNAFEFNGLY